MELKPITGRADLAAARALYLSSFPVEERRQWALIENPPHPGCPSLNGIYADGALKGLVTLWDIGTAIYIEHFAIHPLSRGHGLGSKALRHIALTACGKPVVLEVEPENSSDEARRRIAFYRRNGFALSDYPYVQPPYDPSLAPVPMSLMSNGDVDFRHIARELHRRVYNVDASSAFFT